MMRMAAGGRGLLAGAEERGQERGWHGLAPEGQQLAWPGDRGAGRGIEPAEGTSEETDLEGAAGTHSTVASSAESWDAVFKVTPVSKEPE